jgi:polyhydroxyalkanoate synthesis repressor PhaR
MSDPVQPELNTATPPVVVKKYANRRLYNTESSSYITLDNLAAMVRLGRDFVVYDAKSGEDITRGVLTQIIVEEEGKGHGALLPTGFLRQLIGFYGDSMQNIVPRYLEQALTAFARQQEQMRTAMQQTMGSFFPFGNMEEVARKNIAMAERAMTFFSPFYRGPGATPAGSEGGTAADTPPTASEGPAGTPHMPASEERAGLAAAQESSAQQELAALRAEVESLRVQLADARAAAARPRPTSNARKTPGREPNAEPKMQER